MKILFFETVKSKVIISLFETVRLSVSISPRNLYNSLKSIKEKVCINFIVMALLTFKSYGKVEEEICNTYSKE